MSLDDLDQVQMIAQESGLSPWTREDYMFEISQPESIALVAKNHLQLYGFILARLITSNNCIELYNLAVLSQFRRLKIATRLFQNLYNYLSIHDLHNIYLEVRETNLEALRFYQTLNFITIGNRKE